MTPNGIATERRIPPDARQSPAALAADAHMSDTVMKSRHLSDEIVSLLQTVEIAQGADHRRAGRQPFSGRLFAGL
jgi:hypothetical protein